MVSSCKIPVQFHEIISFSQNLVYSWDDFNFRVHSRWRVMKIYVFLQEPFQLEHCKIYQKLRFSTFLSSSSFLQRCYIIHKSAHKYILQFRQVRHNFGMNKVWSYKTAPLRLAKSNLARENYIAGFKIKSASTAYLSS